MTKVASQLSAQMISKMTRTRQVLVWSREESDVLSVYANIHISPVMPPGTAIKRVSISAVPAVRNQPINGDLILRKIQTDNITVAQMIIAPDFLDIRDDARDRNGFHTGRC